MPTTEIGTDQQGRRLLRLIVDIDVDNTAYETIVYPGRGPDAPVAYGDLIPGFVDNVVSTMLREDAQTAGQPSMRMAQLDGHVTAVEVLSSRTLVV